MRITSVWSALTLNKQRDLTIDQNTINYLILTKLNKNTYSYFNFFRKRQQVIDSLKAKNDCTYSIRILEIIFKFLQYFYSGIRSNNNNNWSHCFSAFLLASFFAVKKNRFCDCSLFVWFQIIQAMHIFWFGFLCFTFPV